MTAGRLTCRWCDYSVPTFYVQKNGKTASGFARLRSHQEDAHPEQDDAISAQADRLDAELETELAEQAERDAR